MDPPLSARVYVRCDARYAGSLCALNIDSIKTRRLILIVLAELEETLEAALWLQANNFSTTFP